MISSNYYEMVSSRQPNLTDENMYSVIFFLLVQIKTHIEFEYPLVSLTPHWESDPSHLRRPFVSKNQQS